MHIFHSPASPVTSVLFKYAIKYWYIKGGRTKIKSNKHKSHEDLFKHKNHFSFCSRQRAVTLPVHRRLKTECWQLETKKSPEGKDAEKNGTFSDTLFDFVPQMFSHSWTVSRSKTSAVIWEIIQESVVRIRRWISHNVNELFPFFCLRRCSRAQRFIYMNTSLSKCTR